jgi:hypothetical protein
MNTSIRFFELTLPIDTENFNKQLNRAKKKSKSGEARVSSADFGYTDEALLNKGIGIAYYEDSKKKKIRFFVHPASVLDDDSNDLWKPKPSNVSKLINKLDKLIGAYFNSDYELGDFKLNRVDFGVDLDVGGKDAVSDYIKILHSIARVKCFTPIKPSKRDGVTKDGYFGLEGNTNGIMFQAYRMKQEKRLLRVEVILTTKETVRAYSGEGCTDEQIKALAEDGNRVLMDTFRYIVPRGDYHKKAKADELIMERVKDATLRRKMLRLVTLVKERKSMYLALKAIHSRDIKEIAEKFAEINLSPVTISKRHDRKELVSLYTYMGKEDKDD